MKRRTTTVTRKGQITIPAEFRRELGIEEGDKVTLVMDDDHVVRMMPAGSVTERTAGIFYTGEPPLTAEELREAAEWAIAEGAEERARD